MTKANKALATRIRNLITELSQGAPYRERFDLLHRINGLVLKLDRAGEPELSQELEKARIPALEAGERAYSARLQEEALKARDAHREALRSDPTAWMHK